MLPKKYKLKSNSEIAKVFKNGKTVKNSFLFLRFAPNQLGQTRIALSIGLKYSKRAVDRNRAKRIMRTNLSNFLEKIKKGYDLVFYFDKNFQDKLNIAETEKNILACLYSSKLLK